MLISIGISIFEVELNFDSQGPKLMVTVNRGCFLCLIIWLQMRLVMMWRLKFYPEDIYCLEKVASSW